MAKAKLKREKRELEKLLRAGRHLEWLVAVRDVPVTVEFKRDLDKAWAEVRRRSLRTREGFEEYCRLRPELGTIPQHPENCFLEALADLVQGKSGSMEALLAVPKLTGAFLAVQQHLAVILQQERDWNEITRLLDLMAREPGKVSRKQLQSLAACLSGSGLEQLCETLGQDLMTFRKLNHKTHLHKPLSSSLINDLADADHQAWHTTADFPSPLRRLVLLPFVEQVRLHLRQAVPPPGQHHVQTLLDAVQRVFFEVAGPHLSDDLRTQISSRANEDCSDGACRRLEQRFATASFEDRLALLRDFRQVVLREDMRADESFSQSFFSLADGVTVAMERLLLHCHREVLLEFRQRLPALAPRDRRSLIAFYDRVLAEDLSLLLMPDADFPTLTQLVLQALESGCYGMRLVLLAPLAAAAGRNRALARLAEQTLLAGVVPSEQDLQWFIEEHLMLALRFPATLRPLFTRIEEDPALADCLAQAVWREYNDAMLVDDFVDEFGSSLPGEEMADECAMYSHEVRKELSELAAQVPQLAQLHRFFQAFPSGRVDVANLRKWCDVAWSADEQCEDFLRVALPLLREAGERVELVVSFKSLNMTKGQMATLNQSKQQLAAVAEFLRLRSEDFQALPLSVLTTLVLEVFPYLEREQEFGSLLVRTYNVLCSRVNTGERDCIPLRDEVERHMRKKAGHRR